MIGSAAGISGGALLPGHARTKRIRDELREEEKAREEIERAQAKAEKDETQNEAALAKARAELADQSAIRTTAQHEPAPTNKPLVTDGPGSLASLGSPARGTAADRSAGTGGGSRFASSSACDASPTTTDTPR